MDEDDIIDGEYVELVDETSDIIEQPDGSAIVSLDDEDEDEAETPFRANLAEFLPEEDMNHLATGLLEAIERDKEARSERDKQYALGLKRTGLGDEAPGGAQFTGASKVVHPGMLKGCVEYSSRAMKELFPPSGPVKDSIPGKVDEAKIAKAQRKTTLMNWQLTVQCSEFRAEMEQLMTQVPLGGAQYLKVGWEKGRNRPQFLFVGIDEMYLPYAATNFYSAERRTHVQYLTQLEYEKRVASQMYRDVDLVAASMIPDPSEAAKANDKIEGRSASAYNEDGLRTVFEVYTSAAIEGEIAPYIVTIDQITSKVLAIYRNWDEADPRKEELHHFVEWSFIPWRGAYPIGLPHMIGGLSGAATGALRALLDSAHINNAATMLKLKGGKVGGQSLNVQPTQVVEIEGGFNVDDIRKIAMPMPFNPPSTVLFELLGFLDAKGETTVRTSMDDLADMQADVPVGTTLARIEQGMSVYSAIHGRNHDAMARTLRILHRLNATYLDEQDLVREAGEALATREDFVGPLDVVPVSDPNVFGEVQRIAHVQTVIAREQATRDLGIYDPRKVEEWVLRTLKVPHGKDLLSPAAAPSEQNAVNENVAASLGRPVTAFPEQDHLAHLAAHLAYLQSPTFGMFVLIAPAFLPVMLGHLKEHVAMWYASAVFREASEALGMDLGSFMRQLNDEKAAPETRQTLDRMLAMASQIAISEGQQMFAELPPIVQQAQQVLQQMQPQMGADPLIQLEQQRVQQEGQRIQVQGAVDQQRVQLDAQEHADDMALEQAKLAAKAQETAADNAADAAESEADNAVKLRVNAEDNAVALQIAEMGRQQAAQNPNPNPQP